MRTAGTTLPEEASVRRVRSLATAPRLHARHSQPLANHATYSTYLATQASNAIVRQEVLSDSLEMLRLLHAMGLQWGLRI